MCIYTCITSNCFVYFTHFWLIPFLFPIFSFFFRFVGNMYVFFLSRRRFLMLNTCDKLYIHVCRRTTKSSKVPTHLLLTTSFTSRERERVEKREWAKKWKCKVKNKQKRKEKKIPIVVFVIKKETMKVNERMKEKRRKKASE